MTDKYPDMYPDKCDSQYVIKTTGGGTFVVHCDGREEHKGLHAVSLYLPGYVDPKSEIYGMSGASWRVTWSNKEVEDVVGTL